MTGHISIPYHPRNKRNGHNDAPFILFPNMGGLNIGDSLKVAEHLETMGARILFADLNDHDTFKRLPWDEIHFVDCRNMRGSMNDWAIYHGHLRRIQDMSDFFQAQRGAPILLNPDIRQIEFLYSKANYLRYFQERDIEITPTCFLRYHSQPQKSSSLSGPDDITGAIDRFWKFIIQSFQSGQSQFVLKPSTSSAARGLIFLDIHPEQNDFTIRLTHNVPGRSPVECEYHTRKAFDEYLYIYLLNACLPDDTVLVQYRLPEGSFEYSAVFIDNDPNETSLGNVHFVRRSPGGPNGICDESYGGTNQIAEMVPGHVPLLAKKIMSASPDFVQNSLYARVDITVDPKTGRAIFCELEGAGACRTWLIESGRVKEYARAILRRIDSHRREHANLGNLISISQERVS